MNNVANCDGKEQMNNNIEITPIHLSTPSRLKRVREYSDNAIELIQELRKETTASNLRRTMDVCKDLWSAIDELTIELENIRKIVNEENIS